MLLSIHGKLLFLNNDGVSHNDVKLSVDQLKVYVVDQSRQHGWLIGKVKFSRRVERLAIPNPITSPFKPLNKKLAVSKGE